jgi:creatinine amidohydrolase
MIGRAAHRDLGMDVRQPSGLPWGRFAELHPVEMGAILDLAPVAWVPSGTLEWHCHHLPLGLDGLLAETLCERAAARAGGVVVPSTYWAIGGVPFPYTMRIEPRVVEALFVSILEQLCQVGFRCAIVLACHYGIDHYTAMKRAALRVMERSGLMVWALPEFELTVDQGFQGGDHAGAWETSLLRAVRPDLVAMDRLPVSEPLPGVSGEDPRTGASTARGQALVDTLVERLAALAAHTHHGGSAFERGAHLNVLRLQVRILDVIRRDRAMRPPSQVRLLMSEPYMRSLDCMWRGNYARAREAAEEAFTLLTQQGRDSANE